jgi:hypothetical protein
MSWFRWLLVALFALEIVGRTLVIGKPREPWTPKDAAAAIIINGLMIVGVVYFWS